MASNICFKLISFLKLWFTESKFNLHSLARVLLFSEMFKTENQLTLLTVATRTDECPIGLTI